MTTKTKQNADKAHQKHLEHWTVKVVRPPNIDLAEGMIDKLREKAVTELANDIVDFRGLSWSYLKQLWKDMQSNIIGRFRDVKLYTVNSVPGETFRLLEKSSDGRLLLLDRIGNTKWIHKKQAEQKLVQDWTLGDLAYFCLSNISNFKGRSHGTAFVETLFEQYQGNPFEGAFVTVPNDCKFASLMAALERHFKKKVGEMEGAAGAREKKEGEEDEDEEDEDQAELESTDDDYEFFVWLEIFSAKSREFVKQKRKHNLEKINRDLQSLRKHGSTTRNPQLIDAKAQEKEKELGEIRNTPMYSYITQTVCQMVGLFDERLIFIDDWKQPTVFRRTWCLWELYAIIASLKDFDFIYDKQVGAGFYEILTTTDTNELETHVTIPAVQYVYDSENLFANIDALEPSLLACKSKLQHTIICDALSRLPGGFEKMLSLLKRYLCKIIAIKLDDDICLIMKKLSTLESLSNKKVLGICLFLHQVGIFMRNIREYDASVAYLSEAVVLYKAQDSLSPEEADTVKQTIPQMHISLARTDILREKYSYATKNLDIARGACYGLADGIHKNILLEAQLVLAQLHVKKNEHQQALDIYLGLLKRFQEEANQIVEEYNSQPPMMKRMRAVRKYSNFDVSLGNTFTTEVAKASKEYGTLQKVRLRLYIVVGDIYKKIYGELNTADSNYHEALDILNDAGIKGTLEHGYLLFRLGDIKYERGNYVAARKKFDASFFTFRGHIGQCNPLIAELLFKRGISRKKLRSRRYKDDLYRSKEIYEQYLGVTSKEARAVTNELFEV